MCHAGIHGESLKKQNMPPQKMYSTLYPIWPVCEFPVYPKSLIATKFSKMYRPCPYTRLQMFPGFSVERKRKKDERPKERKRERVRGEKNEVGGWIKKPSPFHGDSYFPVHPSKDFWLPSHRSPTGAHGSFFRHGDEVRTGERGNQSRGHLGTIGVRALHYVVYTWTFGRGPV